MILIDGGKAYRFERIDKPANFPETRIQILRHLSERPHTLRELAKALNTTEQNIHYHLRALLDLGLVRAIHGERKRYSATADAFGYVIGEGKPYKGRSTPPAVEIFLTPLVRNGTLQASIVVGAPDPHGVFMQRARDGHYAGVLGLFLGQFFEFEGFPVMVDTDVRAEGLLSENLILLGGPAANTASWEILDNKRVLFDVDSPWAIRGRREIYGDDNYGIVAKFRNPYNENNWILLLAGVRAVGTKAAVMAFTQYWEQLLPLYREGAEFYWIVQGFDRNADGHIDFIQMKEYGEIRGLPQLRGG